MIFVGNVNQYVEQKQLVNNTHAIQTYFITIQNKIMRIGRMLINHRTLHLSRQSLDQMQMDVFTAILT